MPAKTTCIKTTFHNHHELKSASFLHLFNNSCGEVLQQGLRTFTANIETLSYNWSTDIPTVCSVLFLFCVTLSCSCSLPHCIVTTVCRQCCSRHWQGLGECCHLFKCCIMLLKKARPKHFLAKEKTRCIWSTMVFNVWVRPMAPFPLQDCRKGHLMRNGCCGRTAGL